uniref:Uncharacterized protein n=1 Tax=Proboscia inermis TaxID=420281 RepID=A0A7S0GBZ0_9STRA
MGRISSAASVGSKKVLLILHIPKFPPNHLLVLLAVDYFLFVMVFITVHRHLARAAATASTTSTPIPTSQHHSHLHHNPPNLLGLQSSSAGRFCGVDGQRR